MKWQNKIKGQDNVNGVIFLLRIYSIGVLLRGWLLKKMPGNYRAFYKRETVLMKFLKIKFLKVIEVIFHAFQGCTGVLFLFNKYVFYA